MNSMNGPTFYIENDWEDCLSKIARETWITCKFKDKSGQHGKVVRLNTSSSPTSPVLSATDGFRVNLLTHNAIEVGLTNSDFSTIFVAPREVYSDIHEKSVVSLDVAEGLKCVSVSTDYETEIIVWSAEDRKKLRTFKEHVGAVYKCRWFPSGRVVLSCGADMLLKIWCSETGRCPVTLKGHIKAINDVAIVDKGRNIISVSKDGSCKLWDCGEARLIANLLQLSTNINCCCLSTVPSDFSLPVSSISSDEREVGTENKILLVGCEDGSVHCVAVRDRRSLFTKKLDSAVNCCCRVNAGIFAVGCQSGNVYLVSVSNDNQHILMMWSETNSPALSAAPYKGKGFFIGHHDGSCVYRSVHDYRCPIRLSLTGSNGDPIYDICCDENFVYAACRDSHVRRYSPDSYICRHFDG